MVQQLFFFTSIIYSNCSTINCILLSLAQLYIDFRSSCISCLFSLHMIFANSFIVCKILNINYFTFCLYMRSYIDKTELCALWLSQHYISFWYTATNNHSKFSVDWEISHPFFIFLLILCFPIFIIWSVCAIPFVTLC